MFFCYQYHIGSHIYNISLLTNDPGTVFYLTKGKRVYKSKVLGFCMYWLCAFLLIWSMHVFTIYVCSFCDVNDPEDLQTLAFDDEIKRYHWWQVLFLSICDHMQWCIVWCVSAYICLASCSLGGPLWEVGQSCCAESQAVTGLWEEKEEEEKASEIICSSQGVCYIQRVEQYIRCMPLTWEDWAAS